MHLRPSRTATALAGLCAATASLALGCADRPEVQRSVAQVQRAVGEGAQGALAERHPRGSRLALDESLAAPQIPQGLTVLRPATPTPSADAPVSELPNTRPGPDGVTFVPDANHQDIATARGAQRVGAAWHDAEGMWFAVTDPQGAGVASPVRVRALVSEEEGLSAPSVVAAGDAFGVAWVDAENGRVRFQVVGSDGAPRGPAAIIHDGLSDPRAARLVFNGREFGLAAQLREGVYFTRVDAQGRRLDAGQLLAEGESVDGVDSLRWDGHAYSVGFAVSRDGRVEHRDHRVTATRAVAFRSRDARTTTRWM